MLAISASAIAQITLPGTKVQFTLPNGEWVYQSTITKDPHTHIYLYIYMGGTVVDSTGDTILPCLRVYVNERYTKNVYDMVYERYLQQPFETIDQFTEDIPKEGMGHIGAYEAPIEGKSYQFRMISFVSNNMAFEFKAETTADTYKDFDKKFADILQTIKIVK